MGTFLPDSGVVGNGFWAGAISGCSKMVFSNRLPGTAKHQEFGFLDHLSQYGRRALFSPWPLVVGLGYQVCLFCHPMEKT